jgi:hypothetical protein
VAVEKTPLPKIHKVKFSSKATPDFLHWPDGDPSSPLRKPDKSAKTVILLIVSSIKGAKVLLVIEPLKAGQ